MNISPKRPGGPGTPISPTYITWQRMKARCLNPGAIDFPRYGGRGIQLCDRWHRYELFLLDMGERPAGLQLDRIDNDGNYEPQNCRWVTKKQNARNRSSTRWLTLNGETKSAAEWCELLGLRPDTVYQRIKSGLSDEEALSTTHFGARP